LKKNNECACEVQFNVQKNKPLKILFLYTISKKFHFAINAVCFAHHVYIRLDLNNMKIQKKREKKEGQNNIDESRNSRKK
jgi:hypothetical protein